MNGKGDDLLIRELASLTELEHVERFQRQVWGAADSPDNVDIMLAIQHEGGLVAGAFKAQRMLGFLFAFPTREPSVQHSHRLAVHPDSRGMGLATRLKWYQREWCLSHGIAMVRWTYDPLRRINAALNIDRLGATACTYHENYYGAMQGINAGVPSDRVVAEWRIDTPGVAQRASGSSGARAPLPEGGLRVNIPADLDALLADHPARAMSERLRVRAELQAAFGKGYRIVDFDRHACSYGLARA